MISLLHYLGYVTVIEVWGFLVLPSFFVKYDHKKFGASYIGTLPGIGKIFNFALIFGPILNTLFLYYVYLKLGNNTTLFALILFALGAFLGSLSGVITLKAFKNLHFKLAVGFFILTTIGNLIFSISIGSFLSSVFFAIAFLWMIYFYKDKKSRTLPEYGYSFFGAIGTLLYYLLL